MNDKIFIAWSGNNKYAIAVKKKLRSLGYESIVGGNNETPSSLFIGTTVISQMNECSHAIFLFQKKENTEQISSNLFFEFGYIANKFNCDKIFIFYIDIDENDPQIPTDLRGLWTMDFIKSNMGEEKIAELIADKFVHSINHVIKEDKINVILNWPYYKGLLEKSQNSPQCSSFEIAQYLLFYTQAVYFNDEFDETTKLIENAFSRANSCCVELPIVLRYCKLCFKLYSKFFSKTNNVLSKDEALAFTYSFDDLIDDCDRIKESELKDWLYASIYENMGFVLYHFLMNNAEQSIDQYKKITEYNQISLQYLNKVVNNSYAANNIGFATLLKAYVFGQNEFANKYLYETLREEQYMINKNESAINAFEMWRNLYNNFCYTKLNPAFTDNLELNYYLTMSKVLGIEKYSAKKERFLTEITNYLDKRQNQYDIVCDYLKIIKNNISQI